MLGWFLTFLDTQVFWDELKLLVDKGLDADIVEDWLREMIRENRGELLYRAFNYSDTQSHLRDYSIDPLDFKREYFTEYGYSGDFNN